MANIGINSGSGRRVEINNGQPGNVTINHTDTVVGEVVLAGSSGFSKDSSTGNNTNFEFVSIVGYSRVKIAGLVDRVRFNSAGTPAGTFTNYHIRVWRKDGATYDLVGQITIPKASIVNGINEHVNSSPFNVQIGDYVGFFIEGDQSNNTVAVSPGVSGSGRFNTSGPNTGTNMNWDSATASIVYWKMQLVADAQAYVPGRRGVAIGDSTVADKSTLSTRAAAIADFVFDDSQLAQGYQCLSIATPGDTIANQRTTWNALSNKSQYSWVILQVGINNMDPDQAASVAITELQNFINDIRSDVPDIKIISSKIIPARGRWPALYPGQETEANQKWIDFTEASMGRGSTPITDVDLFIEGGSDGSNDGDGYLKAEYDSGDGVHENNLCREAQFAADWISGLTQLGFYP